jgi:hypothetical protein
MTIEDKIKEMLVGRGMFDGQAAEVMKIVKAKDIHESMMHRWDDNMEDYSQALLVVLWASAKATALEYIDAECPLAWFRPMFE